MAEYDPEYLEPLRHRRKQEGEMNAVIQDIIVYLCYLVVVMWVAEGPRHINSFYLKVITPRPLRRGLESRLETVVT